MQKYIALFRTKNGV